MKEFDGEIATKTAQLERVKKDLRQAKEDAMQSWLDSRPLIDELEKMQAELDTMRARVCKANAYIIELQAQLGTTEMCIKSAKDEDQNVRMMINDKNQVVHMMHEEIQHIKTKIDKKRRRRSKLKLVLRLKRQTLQTLELTSKAIRLESETFSTSAAQALYYINNKDEANVKIKLTQEEYDCLKKEANRQISQAEWQISASKEEKLAAENNRDLAFKKLQSIHHSSMKEKNNETPMKNSQAYTRAGDSSKHRQVSKGELKLPTRVSIQNSPHPSKTYSRFHVKKKESICFRIKNFIVRSLTKYFK